MEHKEQMKTIDDFRNLFMESLQEPYLGFIGSNVDIALLEKIATVGSRCALDALLEHNLRNFNK